MSETKKRRREIRSIVDGYGWTVVKRKSIEFGERGSEERFGDDAHAGTNKHDFRGQLIQRDDRRLGDLRIVRGRIGDTVNQAEKKKSAENPGQRPDGSQRRVWR
jgi:hypothetical protein